MRLPQGIKSVAAVSIFALLLFENPLETVFPFLSLHDEVVCLLLIVLAVYQVRRSGVCLGGPVARVVIAIVGLFAVGVLGVVASGFQTNVLAIAKDSFAFLKYPLSTVSALVLLRMNSEEGDYLHDWDYVAKAFVAVSCLFCVINLISPMDIFSHGFRHGLHAFKFIFSHPTFLVVSLVLCYSVMEANDVKFNCWKLACLFVLLMTLRDKALGFIGLVGVVCLFKIPNRKRKMPYLIAALAVVLLLAWPKIKLYLGYPHSPRQGLYQIALMIACDFFPLGSGFGTFASTLSGEYYSLAYDFYNIGWMDGLTPSNYLNMGDAGFAYYLAQFGFIGLGILIFTMYSIWIQIMHMNGDIKLSCKNALYFLAGYILIALAVENVLVNVSGLSLAVTMALIASEGQRKAAVEEKNKGVQEMHIRDRDEHSENPTVRVLLVNQGHTKNIGDVAINSSLLDSLRSAGFIVTCAEFNDENKNVSLLPRSIGRLVGKLSRHFLPLHDLLNYVRIRSLITDDYDCAVIGGGELLGGTFSAFASDMFVWVEILKRLKIKTYLYGISGHNPSKKSIRKRYQRALTQVDAITVRDGSSHALVADFYGRQDCRLHRDVVFALKTDAGCHLNAGRNSVMFIPAPIDASGINYLGFKTIEEYNAYCIELVSKYIAFGITELLVYPTSIDDVDLASRSARLFREANLINIPVREIAYCDLDEGLDHLRKCDVVVSGRMHGCILGMLCGCKVVPIPFKEKLAVFSRECANGSDLAELQEDSKIGLSELCESIRLAFSGGRK